jgi:predicted esterase
MNRTSSLLTLLALALLVGCNGGGGGASSRSSAVAPSTSGSTTATTSSSTTTTPPPAGSSAPTGTLQGTFAAREYFLHVPAAHATGQALPLVVAFHGSGDTARNFHETLRVAGWIAAAEAQGVMLLVPATKSPYRTFPVWSGNPNNDLPQMQVELDEVLALVDQEVGATWNVDRARTHALGFSDGGLFLGCVGLRSDRFATCTVLGYGWGAFDVQPLTQRRPVHLACGTADQFYGAAQQTQAFLTSRGHDVLWEPAQSVAHSMIGVSAAIDPARALDWLRQRPPGAAATPPPATAGAGSGGSGGGQGLVTRQVTTVAQGGIPSVTVSYDVYVPTGYAPTRAIPVMFAANMGLQPWQALAEAETFVVVDLRDHDRNGGWTFDIDVVVLDAVLRDVESAWNIDTKRRYLHGFSAGAHWGYAVVLSNADVFAGLGISAGSMGAAIQQGVWPGQVSRKIAVAIRHGTTDQVVPVAVGRADRDRLMNAAHPVQYGEFAGGHTLPSAQDAQAIWSFLKQHAAP